MHIHHRPWVLSIRTSDKIACPRAIADPARADNKILARFEEASPMSNFWRVSCPKMKKTKEPKHKLRSRANPHNSKKAHIQPNVNDAINIKATSPPRRHVCVTNSPYSPTVRNLWAPPFWRTHVFGKQTVAEGRKPSSERWKQCGTEAERHFGRILSKRVLGVRQVVRAK